MKKLEKFINPSELFTSIFLLISITFTVIISLVIANRQEPQYGIREITTGHNLMESTLNLGEYEIRDFRYVRRGKTVKEYTFYVRSGEKFYNDVIKKNEHYDASADFKKDNYVAYGFMWDDFCLYNYTINDDFVVIECCYALGQIKVKFEDELYNENTLCPAPFDYFYSKEELEEVINENYYSSTYIENHKLSFDEIKRIYNSNSEYYKVLDDCVLIKARYEDGDFNKKITDDYYAKIVDENGVPTIYKINDDRDIIY